MIQKVAYQFAVVMAIACAGVWTGFGLDAADPTTVVMDDNDHNTFAPASITIQAGDSVVWMNNGKYGHTATADDGSFDTKDISAGAKSKGIKFATAGEFKYHCLHDPEMKGTIVVK